MCARVCVAVCACVGVRAYVDVRVCVGAFVCVVIVSFVITDDTIKNTSGESDIDDPKIMKETVKKKKGTKNCAHVNM